jgi:hypothetical protein
MVPRYNLTTMTPNESANPTDRPKIEELLARIAPPDTPRQAIELAPDIASLVSSWDRAKTVMLLAGLMTDPRFQANLTRLDWAVRIVLPLANGSRRPKQADFDRLFNIELSTARVAVLEDPIEDFFVESLPTRSGDFLIFSGFWEKASIHTEMILDAFARLPDAPEKANALRKIDALLRLGDAVVERAGLARRIVGSGDAKGTVEVPSDARLIALGRHVRFSWKEVAALSIARADLKDFLLAPEDFVPILQHVPGDSPLEQRVLLETNFGLTLVAPANISTAVRSLLIGAAVEHGLGRALQVGLLQAQAALLRQSNFKLIPYGKIKRVEDCLYVEAACQLSSGRYVHIIQSADGFETWPERAFGSVVPSDPAWVERVVSNMREAREAFRAWDGFVEGMTLWLAGGWGAGRSFEFDRNAQDMSWPLIVVEPADAALLSACEDGEFADWWRLEKQIDLLRHQGFELFNINGFVNLFQWWRATEYALVPPSQIDAAPPLIVEFGTELVLQPRREGSENLDRRAVLHPSGTWHRVARLERGPLASSFGPVYGSLDDVENKKLTGLALVKESSWWIELDEAGLPSDKVLFETWRTAVLWAGRIMFAVLSALHKKRIAPNLLFTLKLAPLTENAERYVEESLSDDQIDRAVMVAVDRERKTAEITLGADWHRGFYRPDNHAEISLGTALGWAAAQLCGSDKTRSEIRSIVTDSAGSADYRHRHAFRVERAIERLAADDLLETFRPIPISASALAKCGSAWGAHPRERGVRIKGKDPCIGFVTAFVRKQQESLQAAIRGFNRRTFTLTALEGLQSAVAQEGSWGRSARALRAIHGIEEDFRMSLDAVNKANGVLRANSMLIELASVETARVGGRDPGRMDMEELQARALQVFISADLLPGLHSDRIDPEIHLSPTGEIRYSHEFEDNAVRFAAELRHANEREREHADYVNRFSGESQAKVAQADLKTAIAAEYAVPAELVREFPTALAMIAAKRGKGVYAIRRSELIAEVQAIDYLREYDAGPLIDRLIMPVRNNWDDMPSDSVRADFDLARFDRRFALIGRPIVVLEAEADPELAIAPGVIERALIHNITGAAYGVLQDRFWSSAVMRSYTGKVGSRLGIEFNESVAEKLRYLDLRAWPSVNPSWCLNQKKTDEVVRLGDIDVLAVSPNDMVVWVVEAKDLKLCRTTGEAARRLSDYRGQMKKNGKPDDLLKHLRRVEYLRTHAASLVGRLKLPGVPKVCGLVIVSAPQPMQQLQHEYSADSTVVMLDRIDAVPWASGWINTS